MKKLFQEFKDFINRGNVMDLAVGVMIGGAFSAIVTSFVEDIISPVLGLFGDLNLSELTLPLGGVVFRYGAFLTAVINFLIIAFVLLLFVKLINRATSLARRKKKEEAPAAPTTKVCPFCMSEIAIGATRCPHCTSTLE